MPATEVTALLTGATTAVGRRLLARLAAREGMRLVVLVPSWDRIQVDGLVGALPMDAARRVEVATGDILAPNLALSHRQAKALLAEVSEVWHMAARHALAGPPDVSWRLNVLGTRSVLDFALRARRAPRFVLGSTVFVAGDRTGRIMEDDGDQGQVLRNPYEETRFYAEREVRAAADRLPITVFRAGILVNAAADRPEGPMAAVTLLARLEQKGLAHLLPRLVPGDGDSVVRPPFSPADYVADGALVLGTVLEGVGTFHLVDPSPPTVAEAARVVGETFGLADGLVKVPTALLRAALLVGPVARAVGVSPAGLDYLVTPAFHDTTRARAVLVRRGVRCPTFRRYSADLALHARERVEAPTC